MAREREATEQRHRDERAAELRQQQETNAYWDPRGGDRYPSSNNSSGIGRRSSVSSYRGPPIGFARTNNNRRVSIIQPTPPPLQTTFAQTQYSTRPTSSHQIAPPFFPPSSYTTSSRPPSARYENPFALPATHSSNISQSSQNNPFAQSASASQSAPTEEAQGHSSPGHPAATSQRSKSQNFGSGFWTADRVQLWLVDNDFSKDWQEASKSLRLEGSRFFQIGDGHGDKGNDAMFRQVIFPELAKQSLASGTGWDMEREREQGRKLRKLVRDIVESGSGIVV